MKWLKWFIAGALAVPLGHQLVLWVMHAIGFIDRAPFSMARTEPFGVPSWISLSFWGGVWGVILGLVLLRARGPAFWIIAIIFGAIAPTLVAGLVVAPLKHIVMQRTPKIIATGLAVNAAWGLMTAVFYRLMSRTPQT